MALARREFLFAFAPALLAPLVAHAALQAGRPMNVVVILSDDQRADTIHALGNPLIQTPNLDRLAARGLSFSNAYTMGSRHGALCIPSRAMLLTGRTLPRCPDRPPAEMKMWPELLRAEGYTTFATGKWHNGAETFARCFSAAENVFFGGMTDQFAATVHPFDPAGKYPPNAARKAGKYTSDLFADSAVEFLRKQPADRPFVLWTAFTTPHDPREAPDEFVRMYDPARMPLPKNFALRHPFDNGDMNVRDEKLLPVPRDPVAIQRELARYYAMITHMDAQIGRILDALEKSGQVDNTLVIFAGDNGLALGSHGLIGKQSVYEHSVKVPLILAGPGVPKGARTDAMCYLLDLAPTIFDLMERRPPESVEGKSLLPVLKSPAGAHRDSIYLNYRNEQKAVRDARYKLIEYNVAGKQTMQLFDLRDDPEEMKDLSTQPAYAEIRERLHRLMNDRESNYTQAELRGAANR